MRLLCHASFVLVVAALALPACGSPTTPGTPPGEQQPPPAGPVVDTFTAADGTRFGVQVVASRLEIPWAMAFAPDGRLFVTERPGRIRILQNGTLLPQPAGSLADVFTTGESGALGLALDPQFATTHFVYVTYTAQTPGGAVGRLVRFREVANTLGEAAVLLDNVPAANIHNGSRVKFGPDGLLYVTFGDAASPSVAQDVAALNGKVLRLTREGRAPADNPFASPVWSLGHRNPQGLDWHPGTGVMYETEHGQVGNDEVNVIERGRNYGWPVIEGNERQAGMEAPIATFSPSVAPSGAAFYRGTALPAFRNDLFAAALRGQALLRVRLDPADPRRVQSTERLLENRFGRLRDVVSGPDGFLYLCTSNRDGRGAPDAEDDRILRVVPAN
jgi:aldose sugar dehydrogenase